MRGTFCVVARPKSHSYCSRQGVATATQFYTNIQYCSHILKTYQQKIKLVCQTSFEHYESSYYTFSIILELLSYKIRATSVVKVRFFLFVFLSKYLMGHLDHVFIQQSFLN